MGTFDSSIQSPAEITNTVNENRPVLPDMALLSSAENSSASKIFSSPLLHHVEIGAATIAAGGVAGGFMSGATGLAFEGAVQVAKWPAAIGLGALGASRMATDMLNIETKYMSTAGRFGAKGLLIGAGLGAAAFTAYEIKNYFEK